MPARLCWNSGMRRWQNHNHIGRGPFANAQRFSNGRYNDICSRVSYTKREGLFVGFAELGVDLT